MKFLVVYEKAPNNYCAFTPNLPVICMSTGDTVEEIQRNIREAMDFHLESMILDGDPLSEPSLWFEEMEIQTQEGNLAKKYTVIFEKSSINYAAFVPALPSCVCAGDSIEEVRRHIRKAIEVHPEGLSWEGKVIPVSESWGEMVEVTLPVAAESIRATGA